MKVVRQGEKRDKFGKIKGGPRRGPTLELLVPEGYSRGPDSGLFCRVSN